MVVMYSVHILMEFSLLKCQYRCLLDLQAMIILSQDIPGNTLMFEPAFLYHYYSVWRD